MKANKNEKIILSLSALVFAALAVLCLALREYFVFFIPLAFFICLLCCLLVSVLQSKQYLKVFEDKICYKTTYRKEKEINILPSEYKIELKHATPKSGYTFKMIFRKVNGEKILAYKPVSLVPSLFQSKRNQWEMELYNIGCDILDSEEVIKNKWRY